MAMKAPDHGESRPRPTHPGESQRARVASLCTPGGFERLVREMSVPAESLTVPPESDEEPDWEHVARVAAANGCELLG